MQTDYTINDFPVFESTQFQFISTHPINNELIAMCNTSGYQKKLLSTKLDDCTDNMKLSLALHKNPRYAPVINSEAIDKYTHEKAINAFRYICIFIKQVKIKPVDHIAIIWWFIEQGIIDVEKTVQTYNIKL